MLSHYDDIFIYIYIAFIAIQFLILSCEFIITEPKQNERVFIRTYKYNIFTYRMNVAYKSRGSSFIVFWSRRGNSQRISVVLY